MTRATLMAIFHAPLRFLERLMEPPALGVCGGCGDWLRHPETECAECWAERQI